MYSQDPKVRKRRIKFRFFGYGVMAVATVVFAAMGMLYVLGYRLDDSFDLERGALVKFASSPSSASITIDGVPINTTRYQTNLSAGEHTVSYSLEGYQGWQKTVALRPGEVRYLTYARLLPTVITTTPVERLESLQQTSPSPNNRWYLLHEDAFSPVFKLVDTSKSTIDLEVLQIPPNAYSGPLSSKTGSFNVVEWSSGSDFFLVKYTSTDGSTEFIRVPRDDPSESVNLTQLFGTEMDSLEFASNTAGVLFGLDKKNTLYRLDVSDPEEPLMIDREVDAFETRTANRVAYVSPATVSDEEAATQTQKTRSLKLWQKDDEQEATELKPVPGGVPVHVAYLEYFNNDYVVLVAGGTASILEAPLSESSRTVLTDTLEFTPSYSSVSPGNRFLLAGKGSAVYVYDFELDRAYDFTLPDQPQRLRWIDGTHLAYTAGGNLRLAEFDGSNTQFVTSIQNNHRVLIDADGEILFSIGGKKSSPIVQKSFLLSEEDR